MHVELYDAKGYSLVPVPSEPLETLYMVCLNWVARNKPSLGTTRSVRAAEAALKAVGKAMDDVKYHGADGGPPCEMERLF